MLELSGGLVTAFNLLLSLVIGIRLARMGRRTAGPELWLGVYFLAYSFGASLLSCTLYMGWSDPALALPARLEQGLNAGFFALGTVGMAGLLLFTQRTFHPDGAAGRSVVWAATALLAGGTVGVGLTEGFRVRVLPGFAYWLVVAVRELVFVWMAVESLRFWQLLRRRLRLGLADALVTNRFLLWAGWAFAVFLLGLSDPLARFWYWAATGTTDTWIPEVGRPIVVAVVALTSLVGIAVATTLFLTFFPTPAFRRWVAGRAPAPAPERDAAER